MERAIQRLKEEADQFKAKVQEKCDEAKKLEQFEWTIQRLRNLLPKTGEDPNGPPAPGKGT